MKKLDRLAPDTFHEWRKNAEVIERDDHGEKVLCLADGSFFKQFRRKRLLSKAVLLPPAARFAGNAGRLKELGIPCPAILGVYRLDNPPRTAVHYEPLCGDTLRQLLADSDDGQAALFDQLARFITGLHDLGIYFRSLHMGNIVKTPDGQLGLIDISDMRCYGRPLSRWLRQRNYRHLLRYREDWAQVSPQAVAAFRAATPLPLDFLASGG